VKTITKIFFCLFLLSFPDADANAQQNDNWYFGRKAGLSFSHPGNQQAPLSLGNSEMLSDEGSASISDEDGNLLFYTNGVTVYNKLHQVMLNGNNLAGNISSCQTIIVPHPGHDSLYYIFTTDAVENDFLSGYRYSIVNIKRDNGNGEIITKNTLLWSSCTERLAAARHSNGIDVWVITNDNNSNTFRSWLITCNGILNTPIVSSTGQVLNQFRDINTGIIKVSPDGKMLCQSHFPIFDETTHIPNFIQLFDFNTASGSITNARQISFPDAQFTHFEFSPNSKLLYITRPYDKKIDQLEITLPTIAAILASRITFSTTTAFYDIQLAPDEKIYCAHPSLSLAAINLPDVKGVGCNFREDQVLLSTGSVFLGLPSHINDFVSTDDPDNGFSYTIVDSCTGSVQFNGYSNLPATIQWEWDFGDGTTSGLQNPFHNFPAPGSSYTVKLKISSSFSCGVIYKSKKIRPSGLVKDKPDFSFVVRCDSGYVRFVNKTNNLSALSPGQLVWYFGDGNTSTDTNPVHSYALPGSYTVKLKLSSGLPCMDDSVLSSVDVRDFTIHTIPDQTIIVGEKVLLSTDAPAVSFVWSPAQWLSNPSVRNPAATPLESITYKVTATNSEGCSSEDSVHINVIQYNDIYVPTAFTPNDDGRNDIIRPFFDGKFTLKEFGVYNRWGQKVFSTSQRGVGWDGKINGILQNTGIFIWIVNVTDTKSGKKIERKGTFVIIR
jgi:gliding motility-associated-like protein